MNRAFQRCVSSPWITISTLIFVFIPLPLVASFAVEDIRAIPFDPGEAQSIAKPSDSQRVESDDLRLRVIKESIEHVKAGLVSSPASLPVQPGGGEMKWSTEEVPDVHGTPIQRPVQGKNSRKHDALEFQAQPRMAPGNATWGERARDLKGLEMSTNPMGAPREIARRLPEGQRGALLEAMPAPRSGDAADAAEHTAWTFLETYRDHLRIIDPRAELALEQRQQDDLGRTIFRFTQSYQGIPVWPTRLNVHLDSAGNVDLFNGSFIPTPIHVATSPILAEGEARDLARKEIQGGFGARITHPELIIYGPIDAPARLGWKMDLDIAIDSAWRVVIDALDGKVLTLESLIHGGLPQGMPSIGSGIGVLGVEKPLDLLSVNSNTHLLLDATKPMYSKGQVILVLDGKGEYTSPSMSFSYITSNERFSGWLPTGVSTARNLSLTYDYFYEVHGFSSVDGEGDKHVLAFVNISPRNNAFWHPGMFVMGFGDDQPFSGSLDVVAHEYMHGVTSHTANLRYFKESGALNEAFSDIFGEMAERYAYGRNDWYMGSALRQPFRRLDNPGSMSRSLPAHCIQAYPAHYDDFCDMCLGVSDQVCAQDSRLNLGGVHVNSTIVSHAFYLLAEGMPGAIGAASAERIFFRSIRHHLTEQSRFIDMRAAAIRSAEELFGSGSNEALKTASAFDAVGILGRSPTPPAPERPVISGEDSTVFVSRYDASEPLSLWRKEAALNDGQYGAPLSAYPVMFDRPSVSGDGSFVTFIDSTSDVCFISTGERGAESCAGLSGEIYSVAMSRDANMYAFVFRDAAGRPENRIGIVDLINETMETFELRADAISAHLQLDTVIHADAMTFVGGNRFLVFDVLNRINLVDGSSFVNWSISGLDLMSGQNFVIVPPMPGVNFAYPSISHTSDDFLVFDILEEGANRSWVAILHVPTGQIAGIDETHGYYGSPVFTGDDRAVVYAKEDPRWLRNMGSSLFRVALTSDRMGPQGSPELWIEDADFGVVYRRGDYQVDHPLAINVMGSGSGSVRSAPGGIDCAPACSARFAQGTVVELVPAPTGQSSFDRWGGDCAGSGVCRVTMDRERTVSAHFAGMRATPPEQRDQRWQVVEVYLATMGGAPDHQGLEYWLNNLRTGWTPEMVAMSFFDQPLVTQKYPPTMDDGELVRALYWNIFGRMPDEAGNRYWTQELSSGRMPRNAMIIAMINGGWANPEAAVDMARLGNRTDVAMAFADYHHERGIRYEALSPSGQECFLRATTAVMGGVTSDPASRDAAIARIPRLLDCL
ncbi:M4 family metallopeptidase [Ectothiorhodospira variabilis]|uniref:M4 family metallopeptidase n=1 Tax=Ectothiorhodospira variabilis TaxID=505694 RepID=UPI001EFB08BC|nr:M4 family metallopeptidase [Ectothiorhodospira variabilis]MCG5495833.1 M4 family metallopeptidase [Ectothiorhodospira variabilis]MCG5504534.1 M4 family metallopeptidase [Ectothiorhodospira variabilis]MCG5507759.1 M4 family metallopeptidase [Ectothiorhodospira variabilis]